MNDIYTPKIEVYDNHIYLRIDGTMILLTIKTKTK